MKQYYKALNISCSICHMEIECDATTKIPRNALISRDQNGTLWSTHDMTEWVLHGGEDSSIVALPQKVLGSNPGLGSFCIEILCSPRPCVGPLWVLWLPLTVQKHDC
ncbi:hypothetical protein CHARACLAT_009114 [Characodon lateralis]|uniref:Uncharacterized protein n=1 Tax=Characodon lateralis TaxID=208331 RepID=A0ABU7E8A8_9TELE|nr:hypothetical protein [Characodon lateralis]